MKTKCVFKAWDTDVGAFLVIPRREVVDALYWAWNYEFDVYDVDSGDLVFAPWENNDFNSELLESYGLRVIDTDIGRAFQNLETEEIYMAPWREV